MASEVVNVGYLKQGEVLIVRNFLNNHQRWLSCIYSLSVHRNESTNMCNNVILLFGFQITFVQRGVSMDFSECELFSLWVQDPTHAEGSRRLTQLPCLVTFFNTPRLCDSCST